MKNKWITSIPAVLIGSALLLGSCESGENREMPPESTSGDTQETGVEGSGDLPGTGDEDTTHVNDALSGQDTTGADR